MGKIISMLGVLIGIYLSYLVSTMFFTFIFFGINDFGFIDYGGYTREYLEISSVNIGLGGIFICSLLGIGCFIINKKYVLILGISAILVGIFSHILWWYVNPMYRFDEFPEKFGYMDSQHEYIIDVSKYMTLVKKYGAKYHNNFRPFTNLEDHIQAINFSIIGNYTSVWRQSIKSAGKLYGYDTLFKEYQDKTAEIYYLNLIFEYDRENQDNWYYENYHGLSYLKDHGSTLNIKNAALELYQGFEANKNLPEVDFFHSNGNYKDRVEEKYRTLLNNTPGINKKVIGGARNIDKYGVDGYGEYFVIPGYYLHNEHDQQFWH